MVFRPQDHYFKKAKSLNYNARSVFKLEEIDQKFKVSAHARTVLDLGCAPGSWSQYLSKHLGPDALIVGLDLTEVNLKLANVRTYVRNCFQPGLKEFLKAEKLPTTFDLVVSDMAPNTTGIRLTDQVRSLELCQKALEVSREHLRVGGNLVCKFFHSADFEVFRDLMKKQFQRVEVLKPQSTRSLSKEIFFIGLKQK